MARHTPAQQDALRRLRFSRQKKVAVWIAWRGGTIWSLLTVKSISRGGIIACTNGTELRFDDIISVSDRYGR